MVALYSQFRSSSQQSSFSPWSITEVHLRVPYKDSCSLPDDRIQVFARLFLLQLLEKVKGGGARESPEQLLLHLQTSGCSDHKSQKIPLVQFRVQIIISSLSQEVTCDQEVTCAHLSGSKGKRVPLQTFFRRRR